jgi:hypothetical protein
MTDLPMDPTLKMIREGCSTYYRMTKVGKATIPEIIQAVWQTMARTHRRAVETGEYAADAEFAAELNKVLTPDGRIRLHLVHDSGQQTSGEHDPDPPDAA